VILSGSLDDGTAGLSMIRTRGGATIAQDPADAPYGGMPRSAIAHNAAEHVVPVAQMPELLLRLIDEPLGWEDIERAPLPPEEDEEEPILSLSLEQMDEADRRDAASGLTCPECGGALWERLESGVVRFACHVGHAYSPASLEVEQSRALEGALWTALRTLEERADLYRRLARRSGRAASPGLERRVAEMEHHADVLREAVLAYGREGRTGVEVN
jgi:two-component system chemotaxis response regulator CheB